MTVSCVLISTPTSWVDSLCTSWGDESCPHLGEGEEGFYRTQNYPLAVNTVMDQFSQPRPGVLTVMD